MSYDIEVKGLTTVSVAPDGSMFRMGIKDAEGRDAGLVLPSDALRQLMMTLFRVADIAFKRITADDSSRLVYPVKIAELQAATESNALVMVLRTADGFEAAFAVQPKDLLEMASLVIAHKGGEAKQRPRTAN